MPSRLLGSGRYAEAHLVTRNGHEYVEKRYLSNSRDSYAAFDVEAKVYPILSKDDELSDRIPKYYGLDRTNRVISLQLIQGLSLRNALQDLSFENLNKIEQSIRETIQRLHKSGVCHGDLSIDNIHLPAILLDFSHAHFQLERHKRVWIQLKKRDFKRLEDTFRIAKELKYSHAAIASINTGLIDHNDKELAALIRSAYPSRSLLEAFQKIRQPTPAVALAIARMLRDCGNCRLVLEMFGDYNFSNPPSTNSEDLRSLVKLNGEIAHSQATIHYSKGCDRLQSAVDYSIKILGVDDEATFKLRFAYVRCLEQSAQTPQALEELAIMILDLQNSTYACDWMKGLTKYRDKLTKKFATISAKSSPRQTLKRSHEGGNNVYIQASRHGSKRICHDQYTYLDRENSTL